MKTYAHVVGGRVIEPPQHYPDDLDVATLYGDPENWVNCSSTPGVAEGWTYDGSVFAAQPGPTLADLKAARIALLRSQCAVSMLGGYSSAALGAAHGYPSAVTDQINLMGSCLDAVAPGLAPDWSTPYWCVDGAGNWAMRAHTAAQIVEAGRDCKAMIVAAQTRLATLCAAVNAAANADTVAAVGAW